MTALRSESFFETRYRAQPVPRGVLRASGTIFTFLSIVFFPWPFTACLALALSLFEPWLPLAAGIFADTLYYAPFHSGILPTFAFAGALATALAFLVRSRLKAGIIEG